MRPAALQSRNQILEILELTIDRQLTGVASLHLRRQLLFLRYVANILALRSHINHVFLADNRVARIYDRCSTLTRRSGICALEIGRPYNIQALMVQAYVPCKMPPWLLRKINFRLDVTNRRKKSCRTTELKLRSVPVEYVQEHTTVYTGGSITGERSG